MNAIPNFSTADQAPVIEPGEQIHHGEVRMAYRLSERFTGKLMHVHSIGWHFFDGKRWCRDDEGRAQRAVIEVIKDALCVSVDTRDAQLKKDATKCDSARGIGGVLDVAKVLEPFATTVDALDSDPYLLNVQNGTVDLRTMEIRPHDPLDRMTKVAGGAWRPQEHPECPSWTKFLDTSLPDTEVREYLQRVAGLGLLGEVREHILPIWTGAGGNGKGSLERALKKAFGDYAVTAEPDIFMAREGAHPTGLMDLLGARWVTVSESDQGRRLAEATMKRLTGGDTIRARYMRQDFVEFEPSHTANLITNHLPSVRGDDPAIWRRIRVIPFDQVIPAWERDPQLDMKLAAEADAILAWAIEGYRRYSQGGLQEPEAVRTRTEEYQHNSDSVAKFVDERCEISRGVQGVRTEFKHLFAAYGQWCKEGGEIEVSKSDFSKWMDSNQFVSSKSNGKVWRSGIRLSDTGEDD